MIGADRTQDSFELRRVRVPELERVEAQPQIRHTAGRVRTARVRMMGPLNESRQRSHLRQSAVVPDRDQPGQLAAGHLDRAAQFCAGRACAREARLDIVGCGDPGQQPWPNFEAGALRRIVQGEPPWPRRRLDRGIDRDDLQEARRPEGGQAIVRPHARMEPARRHGDAQFAFDPVDALPQARGRDHEMIEN
jgi:hypothetical protein